MGLLNKITGEPDKRLLETGLLGRGVITDVALTATTLQDGNGLAQRICQFTLQVALDGRDPYTAACRQRVPEIQIPQIRPGFTMVAVRVHPVKVTQIALDFSPEPPVAATPAGSGNRSAAEIVATGEPGRAVIVSSGQTLGEDLVLLALMPHTGFVESRSDLGFGLMGAELASLALAGRIDFASGRIVLTGPADPPTGDPDLGAARPPPRPDKWVGTPRRDIVDSYLNRLTAAGVVSRKGHRLMARWPIADASRASAVRAQVDAPALGPGQPSTAQADPAQLALAGLVHATRLSGQLYPGWANRAARGRLRQIANTQWTADAVSHAIALAQAVNS